MMAPQTIARGLKELRDGGFIKQVVKGGKYGTPSYYDFIGQFADPYQNNRREH